MSSAVSPDLACAAIPARIPIVCAPMAGASTAALAAAVSQAGALGFLAAGYEPPAAFAAELARARALLGTPPGTPLPIGVGFLGWQLDQPASHTPALLALALDSGVAAVWLSFGADLAPWIRRVRAAAPATRVFVQVADVPAARAAAAAGAHFLVAQGTEAGGHGAAAAPPLAALLAALRAALPAGPPLLAAGGLATGADVARALRAGAAAAVLGTRFLLTPESGYADAQRAALVRADGADAVRTRAFDAARGTAAWPAGVDGRALRNRTVDEWDAGLDGAARDVWRARFADGVRRGDPARMLVWAGAGVGAMHDVRPAKDLVADLHRECEAALAAAKL